MSDQMLQENFDFSQTFKHFNTGQAEGRTPFQGQQVTDTPGDILKNSVLFLHHRLRSGFRGYHWGWNSSGDGQNALFFNLFCPY